MVGGGSDRGALQRDCLARVVYDRYSHEVLVTDHATRWIKVDPTRARNVSLDSRVSVAAVT